MRATARATSVLVFAFVLIAIAAGTAQTPPQATSQPAGPFVGRWELSVRTPDMTGAAVSAEIPLAIVEISGSGSAISGKLVDSIAAGPVTITLRGVAVTGDEIKITLETMIQTLVLTGKRIEDRIEGTTVTNMTGTARPSKWIGRLTTKDKLPDLMALMAEHAANAPPDQKAFDAASDIQNPSEREAAFKKFQADFPDSALRNSATLQIALAKTAPYKAAAIQNFIDTAPPGELRELAEFELTKTIPAGRARLAAQDRFLTAYPKSVSREVIYLEWLDSASGKNVDEARLKTAIDGLLADVPDRSMPSGQYTINFRSMTLNDLADKLMKREVMLDRALALIQEAVRLDGDNAEPDSLAVHTTTLGQVLFKLKRYDEAGNALKKAVQISGHDGDGETQLFLGKYYEVKKQDDLALEAYLKAVDKGSPLDTQASLERLYVKRHGTLASLDKTLDDKYRAAGVGFDPGHYTRPAAGSARVVLAELFTGAECGPCVSADLAFDGMGQRFTASDIAVLIYHLHIPAPDALANADTVARAKYYGTDATPTAVFDGQIKSSGGGDRSYAQKIFAEYTTIVEGRLKTLPLASLDNFKVEIKDNTISVNGEARLLPAAADRAGRVTLHVALSENDVRYLGSNGVRLHNLVVRRFLDGMQGTSFDTSRGTASISVSLDLTTVGALLNDYLTQYADTKRSVKFKEHPSALNPAKLVVVAFVQDDMTKEVLQAAVITPVSR